MTYLVVVTEQAAQDMEETAAWWARERSAEQAERWYSGIRQAISTLTEQPQRCPVAAEALDFDYELRELHFGLGSRATHRAVFTITAQSVVVLTVRTWPRIGLIRESSDWLGKCVVNCRQYSSG